MRFFWAGNSRKLLPRAAQVKAPPCSSLVFHSALQTTTTSTHPYHPPCRVHHLHHLTAAQKALHPLCSRLSLRQVQPLSVLKALFNPQSRFSMRAPESEGWNVGEVRREKRQQVVKKTGCTCTAEGLLNFSVVTVQPCYTLSGRPGLSEAAVRAETLRQL
ncbi:hypothetical protein AOLI_G00322300 [Acnodon oligacanthus]